MTRPIKRPLAGMLSPKSCAIVRPTSALLTGASSTKLGFEIGPDRRHEVHGVGAAEAAVHALALLQGRVGNRYGAQHRLVAAGGE